jgi:iron(III) transport system permease protein
MITVSAKSRIPRSLLFACLGVAVIVVLPVIITVIQAFQGGFSSASDALDASSTPTLLEHTLLLAVVVTPAAGVLGVSAAWIVERTRVPGRRIWTLLLVAPLAVPLFVTSYAWATLRS